MEESYMNLVVSFFGDNNSFKVCPEPSDDFLPNQDSDNFLLAANYRERAFSWDLSLENQVHLENISGSYDNNGSIIVMPLERENVRGRSDSLTEYFKTRSDSVLSDYVPKIRSDSITDFLPLLFDQSSNGSRRSGSMDIMDALATAPIVFSQFQQQHQGIVEVKVEEVSVKEAILITPAPAPRREVVRIMASYQTPSIEVFSTDTRIGAYSREERQQRIDRFRDKKKKRVWRKQIKYDCRKRLADTRPRVKGRFVSRREDGEGIGGLVGDHHGGSIDSGVSDHLLGQVLRGACLDSTPASAVKLEQ